MSLDIGEGNSVSWQVGYVFNEGETVNCNTRLLSFYQDILPLEYLKQDDK